LSSQWGGSLRAEAVRTIGRFGRPPTLIVVYRPPQMKTILILLVAVALVGCAHTNTACQCSPLPTRSLESFGTFDSSTTVEDVITRVGEPDYGVNISGLQTLFYHLADTNFMVISTSGPSQIDRVQRGGTILYDRYPRH
jgi:hypothetical protein